MTRDGCQVFFFFLMKHLRLGPSFNFALFELDPYMVHNYIHGTNITYTVSIFGKLGNFQTRVQKLFSQKGTKFPLSPKFDLENGKVRTRSQYEGASRQTYNKSETYKS